jgi:beta-lactamase superfamily II metal-dependent hydrolase
LDITSTTRGAKPKGNKARSKQKVQKTKKIWYGLVMAVFVAFGYHFLGETDLINDSQQEIVHQQLLQGQQLQVNFLDVGQGASQLIVTPSGKTMLIDGGNNDQQEKMVQYLQHYGVKRLDPDADHIGGLIAAIKYADVGKIYMPKVQNNTKTFENLLRVIKNKGLKITTAKAGLSLELEDKIDIKMIAPIQNGLDNNNMSAVLRIQYGQTSFLLTGDAGNESEQAMISSGVNIGSDVLLVGHHGSKSSTTSPFLQKVKPKYAVIQVGENKYGHPTPTVLKRLQANGVNVYRNDTQGTIEFRSDGLIYSIKTERE